MATAFEEIATGVIAYDVTTAKIAEWREQFLGLVVTDLKDKQQLSKVHDALTVVKGARIATEKRRKELKAASLEYGRMVDATAKGIQDAIEPIESHLAIEDGKLAAEKARLKKELDDAKRKMVGDRMAKLAAVNYFVSYEHAEAMTEEQFLTDLAGATEAFEKAKAEEAERQRMAAEEAARLKAEQEKLAAERAELDRQRKAQEEAQAKIDAEQKRLADEQAAAARKAELEKAQAEAAERAKVETEARLKREREEAEARAKAEAARIEEERQLAEAKRPDKEKLLALADAIQTVGLPPVLSDASRPALIKAAKLIDSCAVSIRKLAETL